MASVRTFLESPTGKGVAVAVAAVGLLAAIWSLWGYVGQSEAAASSVGRTFMCAETGKPFAYTVSIGETLPVRSPHSGRETGFEAELCYWSADGVARQQPTPVLMNRHKGVEGPTFCTDCSRLVTDLNSVPAEGATPPPTKAEYDSRPRGRTPVPQPGRDDGER